MLKKHKEMKAERVAQQIAKAQKSNLEVRKRPDGIANVTVGTEDYSDTVLQKTPSKVYKLRAYRDKFGSPSSKKNRQSFTWAFIFTSRFSFRF